MKKYVVTLLGIIACCAGYAAQTLNNPIGSDGCYIVKWDCASNSFASSNDFEADETFTFAVDITGTQWVSWLAANSNRRLATNFGTTSSGNGIVRDADRLFHIQGNIWGKTIKLSQLGTVNRTIGQQQAIYSNLFGFDTDGGWWQEPSDDIVGNSNCFFRTAPYTGTHTCPDFTTADYAGNPYSWINQGGYAVPCAVSEPCYNENENENQTPGGNENQNQDDGGRGYYNRPYDRYEAEPGLCTTNGQFLAASDNQRDLQSEASHQQAVQLTQVGDYVSWEVSKAGDGLTVRFSLPDGAQGQGTDGNLDVYAGSDKVGTLYLNSYWAWQYCTGNYPDNTPRTGNVVIRMRFDENHVRLSRQVQAGEVLKLVKADKGGTPYTIDFAELEPVAAKVTFESLSGNKVQFDGNGDVGQFIENNAGKTIYLPEGTWWCNKRIKLENSNTHGTQIIGAGMWYTQIYFAASSDDQSTYDKRGIEAYSNNLLFEGIYLNTANNKRYYNNDDSKQVGKGFMGAWGQNSVIRNCWVEHFECGAWFSDYPNRGSNNLLVEHCRFRNNYADGVNCSHGIHGATIRYCSFRNNGDDDMASWSTAVKCSDITYEYCTAENNWRASSLGFFGGKNLTGHHLYIVDGLESGVRVNADFSGAGFDQSGQVQIHDVTVEHCGCKSGTKGQSGDFWGQYQPAVSVGAGNNYDIYNVTLENIHLRNSRGIAVNVRAGKKIYNTRLRNIHVDGGATAFQCTNVSSVINTTYCNLTSENVNNHMVGCQNWVQTNDCTTDMEDVPSAVPANGASKQLRNGKLVICVGDTCYDARGMKIDD